MSPIDPIRPNHSRSTSIPPRDESHQSPDSQLVKRGHGLYDALMTAHNRLEKQGEKEINFSQLNISLDGKTVNAADALKNWYKDAMALSKQMGSPDSLQAHEVLGALQGSMSLNRFREILGNQASNLSSATFHNSVQSLSVTNPTGPSVNITYSSDPGSDYMNIDVQNFSASQLMQGLLEKCKSSSTSSLVTNLILDNISILNKTIELSAKASNGIKNYIAQCNTLIGQMNSAASVFKGNNPPDTINGESFYNAMVALGFPADQISVHGNSGHDMDADNIQTNIAMINSRIDVLSQTAQQSANVLSQLNQTTQQVLQFFENFLQGVSSANTTIASNL